jgi:APA family basic amino acid/polyamine antiporter
LSAEQPSASLETPPRQPELRRGLGLGGAILLTVGSIVGTGIFFTGDDIARALPHAGLILLVWIAGGLLVLAGALTFAELGTAFPRAGGAYHYLKETYGPLYGFLYGWLSLLVYMSGGIAAIATGFGDALGSLLPWFARDHVVAQLAGLDVTGMQVAAVLGIIGLTAVNHYGLGLGAGLNNGITLIKIGSIVAFAAVGFGVAALVHPDLTAPLGDGQAQVATRADTAPGSLSMLVGFGAAMISVLWTYDGWFGLTASAGELREPERNLPRGLIVGVAITIALYLGLNLMYLRAVPVPEMATIPNLGEQAARTLLGGTAGTLMALAIVISSFGCLASTILYSSRIYLPMAQDGLFFQGVGRVHPRWRTPVVSLWVQSAWACLLTLSGSYETLYTYAIFASLLIMLATGAAVFVLRRRRPELPRPYRVWGYPWMPLLFLAGVAALVINELTGNPGPAMAGLCILVLGVPAYAWFRRAGARSR